MESTEAVEQAECLKRLFPTMNPEQQATLAKEFLPFEVDTVSEAIQHHFRTHSFVSGANLVTDIEGRSARKQCLKRQSDVAAEAQNRRAAVEADQSRADQGVERAFATVAQLPAPELERIRGQLVAEYERTFPYLAHRVRTSDPTESPLVAALICRKLGGRNP